MFSLSAAVETRVTTFATGAIVVFVRFLSPNLKSVYLVDNVFLYVVKLKCRFHLKINTIYSSSCQVQTLHIVCIIPEMEVIYGQSLQEMNCNATTVTSSIISQDNGDNAHGRIPTSGAGTANKHRHEPYYIQHKIISWFHADENISHEFIWMISCMWWLS